MAEPSWLEQAREMRRETPRRTRREIAAALGVRVQDVDYWLARERRAAKTPPVRRRIREPANRHATERFKAGDRQRTCRNPSCERPAAPTQAHHAVYRQHVRDEGGDQWDPWNALTLCRRCHRRHHAALAKLPLRALRQNNIEFAVHLFKSRERAYRYLHTYYSGEDPRVERLIEEAA